MDPQGAVRVTRVFAATDAYHVVNPNLVEAQIEGGVIFGLTAMLYGEVTVQDGAPSRAISTAIAWCVWPTLPTSRCELALTGGVNEAGKPKWGGVGECSVAPIAAAVANAIFNATGKRIRSLPFKNIKLTQLTSL